RGSCDGSAGDRPASGRRAGGDTNAGRGVRVVVLADGPNVGELDAGGLRVMLTSTGRSGSSSPLDKAPIIDIMSTSLRGGLRSEASSRSPSRPARGRRSRGADPRERLAHVATAAHTCRVCMGRHVVTPTRVAGETRP